MDLLVSDKSFGELFGLGLELRALCFLCFKRGRCGGEGRVEVVLEVEVEFDFVSDAFKFEVAFVSKAFTSRVMNSILTTCLS